MAKRVLDGKIAIVTGAGRGLGRTMVLGLLRAGAKITMAPRGGVDLFDKAFHS